MPGHGAQRSTEVKPQPWHVSAPTPYRLPSAGIRPRFWICPRITVTMTVTRKRASAMAFSIAPHLRSSKSQASPPTTLVSTESWKSATGIHISALKGKGIPASAGIMMGA